MENIVAWESILGLQLENLILGHLPEVVRALGINVGRIDSMSPYYQPATKRRRGCQVDLLIAVGRSLYVCEVRFRDRIDGSVIDQVSSKLNRLRIPPGYTVRPVLIHAGAVADSVRDSSFFDQILDLDSLLQ